MRGTSVRVPSPFSSSVPSPRMARNWPDPPVIASSRASAKRRLRHGIVYYGGDAWTGKQVAWLRHEALAQLTSDATRLTFDSDYATVLAARARQRVGFAVCLALVLLMLPVVVRSTEEMIKPTGGTCILR